MKHIYSILTFIVFALLYLASATTREVQRVSTTEVTYQKVNKKTEEEITTVSYELPIIRPMSHTNQNQSIGGITIICEATSFSPARNVKEEKKIFFADPDKPGYDIYEVALMPYYTVSPGRLYFNIKVINNLDFPLELNKIPLILNKDGVIIPLSQGSELKWTSGIVAGGNSKDYHLEGPAIGELYNAS
ncbi:MAG TPA: hypothetical protein VI461_10010, partial [Chitinophagaceae bacterium]|nr:hypothetical protein [Chitinophagaceae bacterium]